MLFVLIGTAYANNIAISNTNLVGQDVTNNFTLVKFDISWDNAWRVDAGADNWDAAWIFVKYRLKSQTHWNHATLNYVDGTGSGDGHTEPANTNISSSNDNGAGGAHGTFLYRDAVMAQGSVSYTGVELRWNYGADGLGDGDSVEVCVFAIEMVYVPQNSFYVGSEGTLEYGDFYAYTDGTTDAPYYVDSEAAIGVSNTYGDLYYDGGVTYGDNLGPIPAAFPKGYNAFYCMKYEITQGQYVAFLNKLNTTQGTNREILTAFSRNTIAGTPGAYTTTKPYVAANWIGWADYAAYIDWAALRPMTELEFEKACRGTVPPVADEYAWGTTNKANTGYTISNDGLANEGIATNYQAALGNAMHRNGGNGGTGATSNTISGPARVGIFAANGANTGRETSGSTFYGIMEMTGNIFEFVVGVGRPEGRVYTGLHGDGEILASGDANVQFWPDITAVGSGQRGGSWYEWNQNEMKVSDRAEANITETNRERDFGGRGVRTAPN